MMDDYDFDFDGSKGRDEAMALSKLSKSDEEIAALQVPDDTPELERQALFLQNGQKVQRESVISNLVRTLRAFGPEAVERLVPVLTEQLGSMDMVQQGKAADAFIEAIDEGLLANAKVGERLLPYVFERVKATGTDSRPWVLVLLELVGHRLVPKKQLTASVLELALAFSDPSENAERRMTAALLFGKIATVADSPSFVASTFLEQAMALCQDTEGSVRAAMAAQVPPIARGVGAAVAKQRLLPELLELLRDEQPLVRAAAFDAAVDTYHFWERDATRRRAQVWPPLRAIVETTVAMAGDSFLLAAEDAELLQRVTAGFGKLALTLAADVEPVSAGDSVGGMVLPAAAAAVERQLDLAFAQAVFVQLARHANAAVRERAAASLPEVVRALGAERFCAAPPLAQTMSILITDTDASVRARAAGVAHELVLLLGRELTMAHLAAEYRGLLRTCNGTLMDALLPNLAEVVSMLLCEAPGTATGTATDSEAAAALARARTGTSYSRGSFNNGSKPGSLTNSLSAGESARLALSAGLLGELVQLEQRARPSWRRLQLVLKHWHTLPVWFDSEAIHTHFVPSIFEYMHTAVPCCRDEAADVVVHLMRAAKLSSQRSALAQRLLRELGHGSSYTQRLLFVKVCEGVMERFSANYFLMCGYLETLLGLCADSVSNVRLAALPALPAIKRRLRVPADVRILEMLKGHLDRMRTSDPMRDVRERATAVSAECAKVSPMVGNGALSVDDASKLAGEEALVLAEAEAALNEAKRKAAEQIAEQSSAKLAGKEITGAFKPPKRPMGAVSVARPISSAITVTAALKETGAANPTAKSKLASAIARTQPPRPAAARTTSLDVPPLPPIGAGASAVGSGGGARLAPPAAPPRRGSSGDVPQLDRVERTAGRCVESPTHAMRRVSGALPSGASTGERSAVTGSSAASASRGLPGRVGKL